MKVVIADVMIESEPKPEDARFLEDRIHEPWLAFIGRSRRSRGV
jgi:hypothetical protein